ncbi:hypothetical protein F8388_022368 [Cannabis sativa]|uniref:Uncharacterized protein n=1 Tax=Cannabis sativa TaxID=3483 RepID=A0A7J6G6T0_CANSA|nr:hypothetical protein F8388_022368 [Cannabis sativa]
METGRVSRRRSLSFHHHYAVVLTHKIWVYVDSSSMVFQKLSVLLICCVLESFYGQMVEQREHSE